MDSLVGSLLFGFLTAGFIYLMELIISKGVRLVKMPSGNSTDRTLGYSLIFVGLFVILNALWIVGVYLHLMNAYANMEVYSDMNPDITVQTLSFWGFLILFNIVWFFIRGLRGEEAGEEEEQK